MRLVRQTLLTSEFSTHFGLTTKWHLLAQTGQTAGSGQCSEMPTPPVAALGPRCRSRNSQYLRGDMHGWLTTTLKLLAIYDVLDRKRSAATAVRHIRRFGQCRYDRTDSGC
jgi:hypothetical protein